ncbi:hypothetical protein F4778DRAFT_790208 [Xylariomycetidae sp. FL2044]|nr:hypothetical protein F4778DRAFT_790208 [Xylariomycetidae sp. FL2044]
MSSNIGRRSDLVDSSIGSTIDIAKISLADHVLTTTFEGIAIYNSIELYFIIFFTFKRHGGLYFWSLLISNSGIWPLAIGYILNNFAWVIVVAANTPNSAHEQFLVAYSLWEKIQVTLFFLQESLISGVYLWKCYRFWCVNDVRAVAKIRGMILHLVVVNILVVMLDIVVLYLEYSGRYLLQTSFKTWAYSVKLKVEISILNKLVDLVRETRLIQDHRRITQQMEHEWTQTLSRAFPYNCRQLEVDAVRSNGNRLVLETHLDPEHMGQDNEGKRKPNSD